MIGIFLKIVKKIEKMIRNFFKNSKKIRKNRKKLVKSNYSKLVKRVLVRFCTPKGWKSLLELFT